MYIELKYYLILLDLIKNLFKYYKKNIILSVKLED